MVCRETKGSNQESSAKGRSRTRPRSSPTCRPSPRDLPSPLSSTRVIAVAAPPHWQQPNPGGKHGRHTDSGSPVRAGDGQRTRNGSRSVVFPLPAASEHLHLLQVERMAAAHEAAQSVRQPPGSRAPTARTGSRFAPPVASSSVAADFCCQRDGPLLAAIGRFFTYRLRTASRPPVDFKPWTYFFVGVEKHLGAVSSGQRAARAPGPTICQIRRHEKAKLRPIADSKTTSNAAAKTSTRWRRLLSTCRNLLICARSSMAAPTCG